MTKVFATDHYSVSYINHTQNITGYDGDCNIDVIANIGDSVSLMTLCNGALWASSDWWFYLCNTCPWDTVPNGSLVNPLNVIITQYGIYNTLSGTGNIFNIVSSTGISSIKNINSLNVYPTAVTSSITIQLNSTKPNDIEISFFDMNGKQLKTAFYKNISGEFIKNENTEALANGMYFLRIKTGEGVVEKKLVKM